MKIRLLLLAACSCLLLCSCGDLGDKDIDKGSVTEQTVTEETTTTTTTKTTTTTTVKTTTAETTTAATEAPAETTTTAATTTAATTTTTAGTTTNLAQVTYTTPVSYVAPPSDPNVGYGNDYSYIDEEPQDTQQPVITDVPPPPVTTAATTTTTKATEPVIAAEEPLMGSVKVEQLFNCLNDSGSGGEYPAYYVAESYEDFTGYMEQFYNNTYVIKYQQTYNESYFNSNVLILNTLSQTEGRDLNLRFLSVIRNNETGITTISVEKDELDEPEKVTSTVFVQVSVMRTQYQAHENKGLDWNETVIPLPPKFQYPLAAAKLDSVGWDLKAAFKYSASIPYYGHTSDMPQDAKTSMEWYAEYGFTKGKGNCYVMAAMFCEMARTMGYECHQISGQVPLARGGYGPHSWCEIVVNGKTYVCDPDFQNETGYNGYLIYYGKSGTWRYNKITTMN